MRSHFINGIRLAAEVRGTGLPVVFVHGFPLDHSMWDSQLDAVARRHCGIAPDLRGFGQSEVTVGTVSMEQFADDLYSLLDALEVRERVVLCGLSMGGYVAWQFWRKYRARLRAMVLCDTRAAPDAPEAAKARLDTAERVLREGPQVLVDQMIPKLLAPATREKRPEIAESLQKVILATTPQGIAAAQRGMAQRLDVTPLLAQIDCPALVLVGEFDAISTVDEMRSIADKMPKAAFVTVPAAGHMSPVENPAAVNAAIVSFLATLSD